ncbi:mechanosensitive ion channel family protein [Halobacterium salinarum]|uniref:Mechanosensitive channel protein MscS n=1 Tax=Halobacterium salinarum (strain ATCC 33171 / DSM 3754 / JCM 8978 / NBRC 102687 / NCIMB 764 / 91-R6) TaxID=2597657 RepID=A0A4D6GWN4_HALS9|nr:mechanosensitive ion channel family protein [Halobacterium salinarum]QCC44988.1 mechanosensitive channel protein MscS [Halobacterium salinarum]TYO76101.1 Small-conductance mechanosensitive channel [Halobacterium salinarum DSM 3754]
MSVPWALGGGARLTATAAIVAVVAATVWLGCRLWRRQSARSRHVLIGVGVAAVVGLGGMTVVVLWGVEDAVLRELSRAQVRARVLVRVAITMGFVAVVYVGTGVLDDALDRFTDGHDGITDHQTEVMFRILQITLYVGALIVILGFWNLDLSGLLIGAGFAGIVLGMAARQTLGSVIAGLVLMFSRPFEIGDWVQVGDKQGIVTDITIVNTRLQTFDGEYVMLPNDVVGSSEIVNRSRKGRLRVHVSVGVDYETDVEHAMDVAKDAVSDLDDVLSVPRPQVVLSSFGDSAIVMDVRVWIDKPSSRRHWRAQTAVIQSVKTAFDDAGIKIPFPQREIAGRAETGGFRVHEPGADGETDD